MATLSVAMDGTVTIPDEVLQHLGVHAGESVEVDLLPNGRIAASAPQEKRVGTWDDFFGCLAGDTAVVLTLEQIHEASGPGWAPEEW